MSIRDPGKIIEDRIDSTVRKIHTVEPAVVSSVDKENLKVDIYLKNIPSVRSDPIFLEDVRVIYPQSKSSKMLFNIERGDTVIVLFTKYGVTSLQNEQFVNVSKNDKFNINDVVVLPGIHIDKFARDSSEHSTISGDDVVVPDGITILSENKISINGEIFEIKTNVDLDNNVIENGDIELDYLEGAEYRTLKDNFSYVESAGVYEGGDITDNGDGTVDVGSGSGQIKDSSSYSGNTYQFSFDGEENITPEDESVTYFYVGFNDGNPQIETTQSFDDISFTDEIYIGKTYKSGDTIDIFNISQNISGISSKGQREAFFRNFPKRTSGLILSEKDDRYLEVSGGRLFYGYTEKEIDAIDTTTSDTFTYWYRDGDGGWNTTDESQIDNQHYDDGSGTLEDIGGNKYTSNWIYSSWGEGLHVQYGQDTYSNESSAIEDSVPPVPSPKLRDFCTLIGRVIVQNNADNLHTVESAFTESFTGTVASNHGDLSGLLDDDHTQYLHTDGRRAMSGDIDMDDNDVINIGQLSVEGTGNFVNANLKVRLYTTDSEPDVAEDSLALWDDGTSLWLIYNRDGNNRMVELS